MSLSSHVLDSVRGMPARGVEIKWERRTDGNSDRDWEPISEAITDDAGRVSGWDAATTTGVHRLVFGTGDYFAAQGGTTFYPEVVVVFEVTDADAHHHVPLL